MPTIPRILIVDDNTDYRLILTYQLARIGPFEIRVAADGQEALAVVAATPLDLIFMNLGLPVLDGWEAVRQIRALPAPRGQVPIIAFTAYAGSREERRARQAGCDAYLVKPVVDRRVLQQTVLALLARGPRP
jgi:two-component system, cell cycle response regulator DivK